MIEEHRTIMPLPINIQLAKTKNKHTHTHKQTNKKTQNTCPPESLAAFFTSTLIRYMPNTRFLKAA